MYNILYYIQYYIIYKIIHIVLYYIVLYIYILYTYVHSCHHHRGPDVEHSNHSRRFPCAFFQSVTPRGDFLSSITMSWYLYKRNHSVMQSSVSDFFHSTLCCKIQPCYCMQLYCYFLSCCEGNSLVVQWLGLVAFTDRDPGSIPGGGNKIPKL